MTDIDISNAPLRTHEEVISFYLDLAGKRVLDVGCGDGRFTRAMTEMGATVIGIDPGERQLAKARAAEKTGGELYVGGTADELPVEDQSVDVVFFFNSLHHVPVDRMRQALTESRRALKTGGTLYIAEPLALGPQFELSRPFSDETVVLAEACAVIKSAAGFQHEHETIYTADVSVADFESFRENSTSINPAREAFFQAHDEALRQRFEDLAEHRADGWHFLQYIRINVLMPV